MGWTFYGAKHWKKGEIDRKAEVDELWNDNGGRTEVVKSSMVGATYYGAIRYKETGKVFCAIFLTRTEGWDFGYKDMDETCGYYGYDCPTSILDLLSPTDNELAIEWRKKCREYKEEQKNKRKLTTLGEGSIIKFEYPYEYGTYFKKGQEIQLEKVCVSWNTKGKRTYRWCCGRVYMNITKIPSNFEIVKVA